MLLDIDQRKDTHIIIVWRLTEVGNGWSGIEANRR